MYRGAKGKDSCFQNGQCMVLCFMLQDGFQKCRLQLELLFLPVEAPEGPYQHAEMLLISPVYMFFPHHLGSLTLQLLNYEAQVKAICGNKLNPDKINSPYTHPKISHTAQTQRGWSASHQQGLSSVL